MTQITIPTAATEWTIKEIETMTENNAQEMAIESMVIKDILLPPV